MLDELARAALDAAPDKKAIEYEGKWYDWGWVKNVAWDLNRNLAAVGMPSIVGFVPLNRPISAAALVGLIAARQSTTMFYGFQSPAALVRQIEDAALHVVVGERGAITDEVAKLLKERDITPIVLSPSNSSKNQAVSCSEPDFKIGTDADPALYILTSGTTGPPKRFRLRYETLASYTVNENLARMPDEKTQADPTPALVYYPFPNISGIQTFLPHFLTGRSIVLLDKFNVAGLRDYLVRYKPKRITMPPAGFAMVLDANVPPEELSCLSAIGSATAPIDPAVHRRFLDKYKVPILTAYGATEFAGPAAAMTADLYEEWGEKKFGSVGRPFGGAQIRIIDQETGQPAPPGKEGVIEAIIPRVGPGWIKTSDLGLIDKDGFLFLRGRVDNAIIRGGFKVLPTEIENVLTRHPGVIDAVVVGVKDERLGQAPAAAIQLAPGGQAPGVDELDAHIRRHLYATHVPVRYKFLTELPKTPSLKVDRGKVAALFAQDDDRRKSIKAVQS